LEEISHGVFQQAMILGWKKACSTVQSIAEALHVSPNYLSGLLKVLTGQSTRAT
jgi:hypothetical protein